MPVITILQTIIRQHHAHIYNYNCVLFVFYSSQKVFKNKYSFHFVVSVSVLCEPKFSTTTSFSVIIFLTTRIKCIGFVNILCLIYNLIENYNQSTKISNHLILPSFKPITSDLSSLENGILLLPTSLIIIYEDNQRAILWIHSCNQGKNRQRVEYIKPILDVFNNTFTNHTELPKLPKIFKIQRFVDTFVCFKLMLNKKCQLLFCTSTLETGVKVLSYVPNVYPSDSNTNIRRYCTSDLCELDQSRYGKLIRNKWEETKNEQRCNRLSKRDDPSFHRDGQSVNDMSKVEHDKFKGERAVPTLNSNTIFLLNDTRIFNLMNTWIYSPFTLAQCASPSCRHKQVRL